MKCFGQAYLIESMIMGWYYKHKGRRCTNIHGSKAGSNSFQYCI